MTIIEALNLKTPQDYPSREDYKQALLKAVDILTRLGVMDNASSDLQSSVDALIQKLQDNELALYGKKPSKEEILEELKQVNSEIVELDLEITDLEQKIALKKAKIALNEAVYSPSQIDEVRSRGWKFLVVMVVVSLLNLAQFPQFDRNTHQDASEEV